ncbi:MAG: ribonuclease HII, partial [Candidatus Aenigmarchaeota archaeon]|nr:ribonuclease HII [Candidatus Aenigmarchaeota archaeon]
ASILAKVMRDRLIEDIKRKHGIEFGNGYPSNELTQKFLRDWFKKYKTFPEFVRKSWITVENIKKDGEQRKLIHFIEEDEK